MPLPLRPIAVGMGRAVPAFLVLGFNRGLYREYRQRLQGVFLVKEKAEPERSAAWTARPLPSLGVFFVERNWQGDRPTLLEQSAWMGASHEWKPIGK